jgi:hypothetical protein
VDGAALARTFKWGSWTTYLNMAVIAAMLRPDAPHARIHGELLMLGFEVAQSTVSKYMVQDGPPSQRWKTFLRNHAQAITAIDLCVVPTLTFEHRNR